MRASLDTRGGALPRFGCYRTRAVASTRVVYIGTTKNGVSRVAESAAFRSGQVFAQRGVEEIQVRILACNPRQHVKTWKKLERALLIVFRETYGVIPLCNTQGKGFKVRDEFEYFSRARLTNILEDLA